MRVDNSKLTRTTELLGEDERETEELKTLVTNARDFIESFDWCSGIQEIYAGIAIPGVIGVFLMRIDPTTPEVDDQLWVIVGDVPPAYLVTDEAPDPARALKVYVDLMQEWVVAVKSGRSVAELIPVNSEPTPGAAEMLESRLNFLSTRILPEYSSST